MLSGGPAPAGDKRPGGVHGVLLHPGAAGSAGPTVEGIRVSRRRFRSSRGKRERRVRECARVSRPRQGSSSVPSALRPLVGDVVSGRQRRGRNRHRLESTAPPCRRRIVISSSCRGGESRSFWADTAVRVFGRQMPGPLARAPRALAPGAGGCIEGRGDTGGARPPPRRSAGRRGAARATRGRGRLPWRRLQPLTGRRFLTPSSSGRRRTQPDRGGAASGGADRCGSRWTTGGESRMAGRVGSRPQVPDLPPSWAAGLCGGPFPADGCKRRSRGGGRGRRTAATAESIGNTGSRLRILPDRAIPNVGCRGRRLCARPTAGSNLRKG